MDSKRVVYILTGAVCALVSATVVTGCGSPQSASGATAGSGGATDASNDGGAGPAAASTNPAQPAQQTRYDWPIAPGVRASSSGTISSSKQVDIYDIGPVYAGDELVIEVFASSGFDAIVGVFDADENILMVNDDRNYYAGQTDPFARVQVQSNTDQCYVAVAASPSSATTGNYVLEVSLTELEPPGPPMPQRVYLNFDGASAVRIGGRPPIDIPVFNAAVIDKSLADDSDEIIYNVKRLIEQDYTGLNVEFYSSRDGPPPPEPYSTIHFGAYDPALLGVSENIDEYNELLSQPAIIFVDTFAAFAVLNPDVQEISQALANVASHEAGHLLGLQHCTDVHAIMDITASLSQMLVDQTFRDAPLHPEVFPMGNQDALRTLVENVGGDLSLAKEAAAAQQTMRATWADSDNGPPARQMLHFSTGHLCRAAAAKRAAEAKRRASLVDDENNVDTDGDY